MNCTSGTDSHRLVDNTDWLKAAAILLVFIDHVGDYFLESGEWWRLFGRLAAPAFFFLIGYSHSSRVPRRWIVMGGVLTALDLWRSEGDWTQLNILLNFALLRLSRPAANRLMTGDSWPRLLLVIGAAVLLVPDADWVLEYGAEGWLWALVGFHQRALIDSLPCNSPTAARRAAMRNVTCVVAGLVYIFWEQREFSFNPTQLVIFAISIAMLCIVFCKFRRGPSPIQPPAPATALLQFVGRRTLELYFVDVAVSSVLASAIKD